MEKFLDFIILVIFLIVWAFNNFSKYGEAGEKNKIKRTKKSKKKPSLENIFKTSRKNKKKYIEAHKNIKEGTYRPGIKEDDKPDVPIMPDDGIKEERSSNTTALSINMKNLKKGIILSEILAPPLAKRKGRRRL